MSEHDNDLSDLGVPDSEISETGNGAVADEGEEVDDELVLDEDEEDEF